MRAAVSVQFQSPLILVNLNKSSIDWEIDRGSHAHLEGSNLSIDERYIAYIDLPGGCLE